MDRFSAQATAKKRFFYTLFRCTLGSSAWRLMPSPPSIFTHIFPYPSVPVWPSSSSHAKSMTLNLWKQWVGTTAVLTTYHGARDSCPKHLPTLSASLEMSSSHTLAFLHPPHAPQLWRQMPLLYLTNIFLVQSLFQCHLRMLFYILEAKSLTQNKDIQRCHLSSGG